MPCPSTHPIQGTGSAHSAYYTSRASAESAARSLVDGRARVDAGLQFNGFACPTDGCRVKSWTMDSVQVTGVDTDWAPIASLMWLENRFSARADYSWSATITCEAREGDADHRVAEFVEAFEAAVLERSSDQWTVADGSLGNVITTFTGGLLGDGCVAWALWMLSWLYDSEWIQPPSRISVSQHHIGSWPFYHQIVIVRFPNGREFVLDPWRDQENPVHDRDAYERKYGPIKPGFSQ